MSITSDIEQKQQLKDLQKLSKKISEYIKNDELSYEDKTDICRQLIDNIIIHNDDVEITLSIPDTRKGNVGNYKEQIIDNMFNDTNKFISDTVFKAKQNTRELISSVKLCSFIGQI